VAVDTKVPQAAVAPAPKRTSSVALKILMAGTGILLVLFLYLHMIGNLKIFFGETTFDHYAHWLRDIGKPLLPGVWFLWILRTGAPWRDLPERYGPVGTVSSRFYRWRASGVWDRILAALQAEAEAAGEIDWDLHFVDATVIRAHQHAAGARRDGAIGG